MKSINLSKVVGTGILIGSLAIVSSTMPGFAQSSDTTDSPSRTGTTGTTDTRSGTDYARETRDDGFDWGWLGLLGLAGLAGLARKREEPVRYRETDEVSRPGSRL